MQNQAYLFIVFILNGFLIGLLFDTFRVFRKSFKTNDFLTQVQDTIFWVLTGLILIYSIFKFNNGNIRAYIFIGVVLGAIIYLLLFSKLFIKISVSIISWIKKIIIFIIIKPVKYLVKLFRKIFIKPISFIIINIKKISIIPKEKIDKKKDLA